MTSEMTSEMTQEMMSEIIELQKHEHSIFDPNQVEAILRKGYADEMEDLVLMKQVFDKLKALRRRYLIWYGVEWEQTLKETPTLTTDEYILGLLVSLIHTCLFTLLSHSTTITCKPSHFHCWGPWGEVILYM